VARPSWLLDVHLFSAVAADVALAEQLVRVVVETVTAVFNLLNWDLASLVPRFYPWALGPRPSILLLVLLVVGSIRIHPCGGYQVQQRHFNLR
jgi:hypothetical protein